MSHTSWGLSRDFRLTTMLYGCPRSALHATHPMLRRTLLSAVLGTALLAPPAVAAEHVPGEVVVRYVGEDGGLGRTAVVQTDQGESVREAIADLRDRPRVLSATKNVIARIAHVPNDPGRIGVASGWQELQWNFSGPFGVNAPAAWDNVAAAGRPGGAGVVVAVLDTGVAYATRGRFVRSPDLGEDRFVPGHDFVEGDRFPHDVNGHGTHVASTIAESVDNDVGVTGLAYGARIMPVRVLDRNGEGDSVSIAKGIRYAARHGADIVQMTFTRNVRTFGLPGRYIGTSMAAPHVSATAALVLASGVLGADPSPRALSQRLLATARDLGLPGADNRYGAGLVDAAAATAPV